MGNNANKLPDNPAEIIMENEILDSEANLLYLIKANQLGPILAYINSPKCSPQILNISMKK